MDVAPPSLSSVDPHGPSAEASGLLPGEDLLDTPANQQTAWSRDPQGQGPRCVFKRNTTD